jgi:hypothetical protein
MNGKLEFHPAMSVKSNPDLHLTATGRILKAIYRFTEVPVPAVALPFSGHIGIIAGASAVVLVCDQWSQAVNQISSQIKSSPSGPTLTPRRMVSEVKKLAGDWRKGLQYDSLPCVLPTTRGQRGMSP